MNNLKDFVLEYRTAGSVNKEKAKAIDAEDINPKDIKKVVDNGKVTNNSVSLMPKKGEPSDPREKGIRFELDVSTPEDQARWGSIPSDKLTNNRAELMNCFQGDGMDFLILGEAGWAKTASIVDVAKQRGYDVITIYLEHATGTDLGGIPIPVKDEHTNITYQDFAIPVWAAYMQQQIAKNPKKKFLLFFDEMNNAAPDVFQALYPIVKEHIICNIRFGTNILTGAAGNKKFENEFLLDLPKPLLDRFTPIDWEVHTDDTWNEAEEYAHSVWDKVIGKDVVDAVYKLRAIWDSPRTIERRIFTGIITNNLKANGYVTINPKIITKMLHKCVWADTDVDERTIAPKLEKLAQYLYDYIKNGGSAKQEDERRSSKNANQIDKEVEDTFINCLTKGFFTTQDGKKYFCTLENILKDVFNPEETGVNAEVLNKIVKKIEANGKKVKFKTNADLSAEDKKRWLDPAEA